MYDPTTKCVLAQVKIVGLYCAGHLADFLSWNPPEGFEV